MTAEHQHDALLMLALMVQGDALAIMPNRGSVVWVVAYRHLVYWKLIGAPWRIVCRLDNKWVSFVVELAQIQRMSRW